jgi:hypothetical protein
MILSWYRQNASDFGILRATSLLLRVVWRRTIVNARNTVLPARVECPCCGWAGNRFLDYKEMGYSIRNIECPQCGSHSRHRAFFLWLKNDFQLADRSGVALVFAPEKALASFWQDAQNLQTFKIDIVPARSVDVLADVMSLPFTSGAAEIIWCHHVLEQVTDDQKAMRELCRVLKNGTGQLIISAGLSGESSTREFGRSEKGLSGNRRSYGTDIAERLTKAGLIVQQVSYGLAADAMTRYAVRDDPFYVCRKA